MSVKHKTQSGKVDAGDPALVSSNAWNANHNYPAFTIFGQQHGDDPYATRISPAAVTDPYGANYHTKVDLSFVDQARVVASILQNVGNLALRLAVQYSLDGATAWTYLDGVDGPYVALTLPVGPKVGAWINVAAGAKADVFLRWVTLNGNGSQANQWFHHYLQVR
jgi:hypothetical protein